MGINEAKIISMKLPRKLKTIRKSKSRFVISLSGNDLWEGHMYFNPLILYPFIRYALKDSIELLLRIVFERELWAK